MSIWILSSSVLIAALLLLRRLLRKHIHPAVLYALWLLGRSIYVTPEAAADKAVLRHVLTHEATHYRHGDPLWAVVRGVCLAVHWWNPMVWLAAIRSKEDAELACDACAVKRLGEAERMAYGRTLVSLSCTRSTPPRYWRQPPPCPAASAR